MNGNLARGKIILQPTRIELQADLALQQRSLLTAQLRSGFRARLVHLSGPLTVFVAQDSHRLTPLNLNHEFLIEIVLFVGHVFGHCALEEMTIRVDLNDKVNICKGKSMDYSKTFAETIENLLDLLLKPCKCLKRK